MFQRNVRVTKRRDILRKLINGLSLNHSRCSSCRC